MFSLMAIWPLFIPRNFVNKDCEVRGRYISEWLYTNINNDTPGFAIENSVKGVYSLLY